MDRSNVNHLRSQQSRAPVLAAAPLLMQSGCRTFSMAITTSKSNQRMARLLAEGASIVAVHAGKPGIDITPDVVGLLELCRGASEGLERGSAPAED